MDSDSDATVYDGDLDDVEEITIISNSDIFESDIEPETDNPSSITTSVSGFSEDLSEQAQFQSTDSNQTYDTDSNIDHILSDIEREVDDLSNPGTDTDTLDSHTLDDIEREVQALVNSVSDSDTNDSNTLPAVVREAEALLNSETDTESLVIVSELEDESEKKGSKRVLESDGETEPSKKKRSNSTDDEDEGKLCPICLDTWSNSGEHRVCSLKCGHLFGHSCLQRWLDSHSATKRTCPTCKRRVLRNDVRFIYVKKLIALDTTELDKLKTELNEAKKDKNKLQIELRSLNILMEQKISDYKDQIEKLKMRQYSTGGYQLERSKIITENRLRLYMDKSMEINKDGGCRVFDYNPLTKTVAVSMNSPNPLFSGYGLRKIDVPKYKPTGFVPLHSKPIRDLAYANYNDLLLSVSLDMKAKLVDMSLNSVVTTFSCHSPLWSCCWDSDNPNIVYCGEQQGGVSIFDIRNPSVQVTQLLVTGDASPVVSLVSTSWKPGHAMPLGGVLCCKLNSCWAFEKTQQSINSFEVRPLPLEGPFMSLCFDSESRHMLVSARPNQRIPYTRHTVCELALDAGTFRCTTVHTFQGAMTQKLLSRSCLMNMQEDVCVAAHHETDHNVTLWSVGSGTKVSSVPAHLPVIDLCSLPTPSGHYLASLNEKKLDFFKIDSKK